MNLQNHNAFAVFFSAALLAACAGCSPASATGAQAVAPAPALAFAATDADVGAPACALEGTPRVVAAHVAPMAGVSAASDGTRVWLRFATKGAAVTRMAIDPESLDIEPTGVTAPQGGELADTDRAAPIANGPVAVGVAGGRELVAWTSGSLYDGLRVRAATVDDRGDKLGASIDLGYQGSAIGRPAVAVAPSGRGVLAFIESNERGFQLVVTRVACPVHP